MTRAPMTVAEMTTKRVFVAIPLAALVLSLMLATIAPAPGGRSAPALLALATAALAWELVWFAVPVLRGSQPRQTGWYVAGFLLLAGALAAMQPWFGFFAWCAYLRIPLLREQSAQWPATVFVASILALCQIGGAHTLGSQIGWVAWAVLTVANAAIGLAMMGQVNRGRVKEQQDADQILALETANARLAAAIEENERLRDELVAQARVAATSEERSRMAGEIHDTIAQGLAGVVTQLEAAGQSAGDELERHLALARELARDSLADARRSVRALQPARLSGERLGEALQSLVEDWRRRAELRIDLAVTGDPRPYPPDVEVGLYRTAQEALANAARHSGAQRVGITLSYLGTDLALDVRDDGQGFDPHDPPSSAGGFGLSAMRDRVRRLGGRFEIDSSADRGTTVTAIVPTRPRSAAS